MLTFTWVRVTHLAASATKAWCSPLYFAHTDPETSLNDRLALFSRTPQAKPPCLAACSLIGTLFSPPCYTHQAHFHLHLIYSDSHCCFNCVWYGEVCTVSFKEVQKDICVPHGVIIPSLRGVKLTKFIPCSRGHERHLSRQILLVVRQGYHETMSKLFGLAYVYLMLLECQFLKLESPLL